MLRYMKVSRAELDLIQTIKDVGHGEIYGLGVEDGPYDKDVELSAAMGNLIDEIRKRPYVDMLTIHNGNPTILEIDSKIRGFKCRTKVKLD